MFRFTAVTAGFSQIRFSVIPVAAADSTSFGYVTNITDPNLTSTQNCLPAVLGDMIVSKVPFARCGVVERVVSAGVGINWRVARDHSAFLIARTASR